MNRLESPEELRDAVVHRAGDAAQRVAEVADDAGSRIAKVADDTGSQIAKRADRATARSRRLGLKTGSRIGVAGTKIGMKGSKLGARGLLCGAKAGVREKLRPAREAKLKAELQRTSRQIAHEASDLGDVVESLNTVIEANRRAGAAGRTRLLTGIVVGTMATHHLDAEHGAERRRATVRRIAGMLRGELSPTELSQTQMSARP